MTVQPFLKRVRMVNYRSIKACDVHLGPLAFLVGPNGSGKSNFLDGLRLVTDALQTSLDHALRDRGGIKEVCRRSKGHPTHFAIRLDLALRDGSSGSYAFKLGALPRGRYEVQEEECRVSLGEQPQQEESFRTVSGVLQHSTLATPLATARDRLCLVNASSVPEFRGIYEALSTMGFYNLNPDSIRELQQPDPGELLRRDGSNLASVLDRLLRENPSAYQRIEHLLERVAPGVQGVRARMLGPKETLEFRQQIAGDKDPWRFPATSMSDGTLRVLGVLVALFQSAEPTSNRIPLIGIEEPEIALHPAAVGALLDGLLLAQERTQTVVTSHSPDLLDDDRIPVDAVLAVSAAGGVTEIAPVDEASRSALRDSLYTAGELLRLDQLQPDRSALPTPTQLSLFGEDPQ